MAFYLVIDGFQPFLYRWPLGQAAKTTPSHGVIGSSILPGVTIKKLSIGIDSFFIPFFRTACLPLHLRSTDSPLQRIKRESAIAPTTQAHSHSNTVEQNLPVAARQKLCFEGWDSGKMRLISCTRHFQRHTRSRQIIKYSTAHTPIIIAAAATVSFPQKNAVKSSTVTVGINA